MRATFLVSLATALLAAACSARPEDAPEPGWTRLDNGLRFRVRRIDGAKDVAVLTQLSIGADHDPEGRTGLSHLVEHLYVTSAAGATPARTADAWMTKYASRCEAVTTDRMTSIFTVVAPAALESELTDVAARLSDLKIEASDLDRESPRVLEQIRDAPALDPRTLASRLAMKRLFPGTCRTDVGGVADEVRRLKLDEVRTWADRFYRPVNARLVVAGDVDEASATALVTRILANLPPGERTHETAPVPPQPGVIEMDAPAGPAGAPRRGVCIAYPFEGAREEDRAAAVLFIWDAMNQARQSDVFLVSEPEGALVATWVAGDARIDGDEPVAGIVHAMDSIVANLAVPPPGEFETSNLRDMTCCEPTSEDVARPERFAIRLACPQWRGLDPARIQRIAEHLPREDVARFAAKWLAPERRVVAVVRSARREGDADTTQPPDESEIRILVRWDEKKRIAVGKVGDRAVDDDDKLEAAVVSAEFALRGRGRRDAHVTLDCDPRVPWASIVAIMKRVRRAGVERVGFAAGGPGTRPK